MRRWLLIPLVGLATAAQAARPPEVDGLIGQARAAIAAGDPTSARAALEKAAAAAPDDPEVLRLLGTAQSQTGQTDQALVTLGRAAQLAPGDRDIQLAIGRTHYYRGDAGKAQRIARDVLTAEPDNAEARELAERARRSLADPNRPAEWRLDWSASYSDFEDDARERWLETSVALGRRLDDRTMLTGRADIADRFGRTDVYGEARVDRRFANGSAYVALGGTPGADFLPEWAVQAGGGLRAYRGGIGDTVLTVDARHARYRTGSVETLSPGIEQYLADGRFWLTGKLFVTWDENDDRQTGYLVRGDAQVADRLRLFAGYADAPETSENVTLTTRTLFGGAVFDLTERLALRLDYAHDDRERSYKRHAFTVGLGVRF